MYSCVIEFIQQVQENRKNDFDKFNNTRARLLDSSTLKLCLRFCHYFRNVVTDVITKRV